MNLSLLIAFVCFLIAALATLFTWDLGKFNAIAWGLTFFVLGHLYPFYLGNNRNPQ